MIRTVKRRQLEPRMKRQRRHRLDRRMLAEKVGIMDLDAMYEQPDLPATERIPPTVHDFEQAFYAAGDEAPRVEVTRVDGNGSDARWQVSIRSSGALKPHRPLVQFGEMISARELRKVADRSL